jgi:DksA/TraR C4-type zinc finger protein
MTIREIEAALNCVASGTYGLCRRCWEEIAAARLRVLPTAILFIDCVKTVEKIRPTVREEKGEHLPVASDDFQEGSYGKRIERESDGGPQAKMLPYVLQRLALGRFVIEQTCHQTQGERRL